MAKQYRLAAGVMPRPEPGPELELELEQEEPAADADPERAMTRKILKLMTHPPVS